MAVTFNASTSSGLVTTADNSGQIAFQSNGTQFNPLLTAATAQASTSGTSIDFTSIPSWVKRITVMFSGVSTSGTSIPLIQIGSSGGIEVTGYLGTGANISGNIYTLQTTGFALNGSHSSVIVMYGQASITLISANTWVCSSLLYRSDTAGLSSGGGSKSLSGTLDRVRITTVNGTDTFDAGTINILYE